MRLNTFSILTASMLATAGLSADSVNLAGAFDLKGCQAKCSPDNDLGLAHCQAQHDCWQNKSAEARDLEKCLGDAQRTYDLAVQGGAVTAASANADASSAVVTDADNVNVPADDHKGYNSAD